jgi:hypothetical protein
MTYAVTMDVPGLAAEQYDAVHRALLERARGTVLDGLLLHLAWPDGDGMRVVEVWRSQEDSDRYGRELLGPVIGEVFGEQAPPQVEPVPVDVRGLVVPPAGVTI